MNMRLVMSNSRKITYSSYADKIWQRLLIHLAEAFTGRKALQNLYDQLLDDDLSNSTFWDEALKRLHISVDINQHALECIPQNQPLIVIANHPFGVIDGLIICQQIARIRPDFKIVLNDVLCQDSRIENHVLPIDFSPTRTARIENLNTRKACLQELESGGAVIIFPAGGVSTASTSFGKAVDLDWKPFTMKLIEKSKANTLPVFFHGQNSTLFQLVSQFSITLRIGMLVREVNNKRNSKIKVNVGQVIPFAELEELPPEKRLEHLRQRVYNLA